MSDLADAPRSWPVTATRTAFEGSLVGVRVDEVAFNGETLTREVVTHPGAVGVVAIDDDDRVFVLGQYRHAAAADLVELPAGLLDVAGEDPLEAARRELVEEAGLAAERWRPLLRLRPSPGSSDEVVHVFLAEGLSEAARDAGFTPHGEEATMTMQWVPLADLVDAVMAGRVTNALTIAGSLAVWRLRCGKGHSSGAQST